MVERSDWNGILNGRRKNVADVELKIIHNRSKHGGSGAFRSGCDDGNTYWIKPLNCPQGPRVPVTEQIIGRVGLLIDAPVCRVRTVNISSDFIGWPFRPGILVEEGIAHGSLEVKDASETRQIQDRLSDHNSERQAYIYALHDWCWGGDAQWLMSLSEDRKFYSHDHGWFLPPVGPDWNEKSLMENADKPNEFPPPVQGLKKEAAALVISKLRNLDRAAIARCLSDIPESWPVTDEELEAVGYFLEKRRLATAERLELKFANL